MEKLGARSIIALVVPQIEIAYQILALNTEKAHNVREKSLEAIRMARELAQLDPKVEEAEYGAEFEEAPFLTLGACYEQKGNFSGGAYYPVLRRVEDFLEEKLPKALAVREKRAKRLFALDEEVGQVVERLKDRGLRSPYLKNFVVARINPLRFRKGVSADFDKTFDQMLEALAKFDASKVRPDQLAGAAGPPEAEG
jgi:ParB family chromosome partitioning protein